MLAESPVLEWVKTPVVVPLAARQLVVGAGEVPKHVPRAEMEAGDPRDVTFAPRVAVVVAMEAEVGEVTVGTELGTAQILSFHSLPEAQ